MVDQVGTPAPQGTPAPAPAPAPAAAPASAVTPAEAPDVLSFIDKGGVLKEGWQKAMLPEDGQERGTFKGIADLKMLGKRLTELDILRGKQGKMLAAPGSDATPTEIAMFREAIGVPKASADYKAEIPADVATMYTPEVLAPVQERALKAGLTPAQFQDLVNFDIERTKAGIAARESAAKQAITDTETALKTKWGAAYDERLNMAKKMFADNVAAEYKPQVEEIIGNNPILLDFLATIGKKFFTEGTNKIGDGTGQAMTPAEATEKMNELIQEQVANPTMKGINPAKWQRLSEEIRKYALMAQMGQ
jgi:hypothetical protein